MGLPGEEKQRTQVEFPDLHQAGICSCCLSSFICSLLFVSICLVVFREEMGLDTGKTGPLRSMMNVYAILELNP